jgi:O-acetyl-ADP-ribose deacetylase (regulator of RNase III)
MDAGIDRTIVKSFGSDVQKKIQKVILEDYLGEQPVGTSIIVETGSLKYPYVAHSPTMRVPLNIDQTDNVYLAMWATLTGIHRHNRSSARKIETLACPGLGTGTGGMNVEEAALQICLAYEHYLSPPMYLNGSVAQQRHERVHYGSRWGFRNPRKLDL